MAENKEPTNQANALLEKWFADYSRKKKPILLDFRKEVSWIRYGERLNHNIHAYPAKLLPHIPAVFLQSSALSNKKSIIFDPFSGSGTVGVEALNAGKLYFGVDANPLAALISSVKCTKINFGLVIQELEFVKMFYEELDYVNPPDVVNLEYWFYPHVIRQLSRLKLAIENVSNKAIRNFLMLCFSAIVKKVSLSDLNMSVPVRLRVDKYPTSSVHRVNIEQRLKYLKRVDVLFEFECCVLVNIERMKLVNWKTIKKSDSKISEASSVNYHEFKYDLELFLEKNQRKTVDLIITSPPYVGAQKYIRASSLNMGWLGLCDASELRGIESRSIGREHYCQDEYSTIQNVGYKKADNEIAKIYRINPLRSYIASNYLIEMKSVLNNAYRVLKRGGHFVLVIGDNLICGNNFYTHEHIKDIAEDAGFSLLFEGKDTIKSRGLMTRRNKNSSLISYEWVLVFSK